MATEVEINATLNPEGTIRGLLEIEKQTSSSAKSVEKLQKEYDELSDLTKKINPNAKGWAELNKELKKLEKELESAKNGLDDISKSGKAATGSIADMQQQLELLTQEISGVAVGSAEFDELSARIRVLDGNLTTANESLAGLSAEDKAGRIGQLAGGLGNVAASAALIGGQDSAIADFFGGIESALGIMFGLQGAIEAVTAAKKLFSVASLQSTVAVSAEATAMSSDALATVAMTGATEGATVASWALNASLLANPVFWIVAVIMAVIAAFAIFTAATKTAGAEHDKLNAELERESQLIEANRKSRERANGELENEIANKQKLIQAEIDLLEATGNRSKEQEKRLKELKQQLGTIDDESLDLLGTETWQKIKENTVILHKQIQAAKKGVDAVWDEDWGAPDFNRQTVKKYFDDVNLMQIEASKMYKLANEADTDEEKKEYIKRAQNIEDQVTRKTARILGRLNDIKGTLGDDASEEMQKVIDDITKFGDRANESADQMSAFQKSIDNFNTDNMVEELEQEKKAQEEAERRREKAREAWKEFISNQIALREELAIARMNDQEKELHELDKWFKERQALTKNDAVLSQQLNETYLKRKQEIADKFAEIEAQKLRERSDELAAIQQETLNNTAVVESMRLAAVTAMAEEEANLKLEAWQKALEGNREITNQELEQLKQSLSARRDAVMDSINQESQDRKKAAEIAKNAEIAEAEKRIEKLKKEGLDESEAQRQLTDLKLSIVARYNREVETENEKAAFDKRTAQKEYDDAEYEAEQDQKAKLLALNEAHNEHLIDGLEKISAALDASVGQFEGTIGKLAGVVSSGISDLGGAIQGLSTKIKEIKAKTKEGVTLTPEEEQALKESTVQAVSMVVGAAGSVAQGIVDSITASNKAKTDQALSDLEANKKRELDIIQQNLAAGTISQADAEKERNAIEFKAAQQKYEIEKKAFEDEKKAKIANATIAGLTGAVSAFAGAMQLGPIAGPIVGGLLAAAVGSMTLANVASIKRTKFGGSPPQPNTGIASGAAGSTPSTVDPSNFLPTGSSSGNEPGSNQTGQNNGATEITVKAVVVETDVTNTQNKVSAIESRSEFK